MQVKQSMTRTVKNLLKPSVRYGFQKIKTTPFLFDFAKSCYLRYPNIAKWFVLKLGVLDYDNFFDGYMNANAARYELPVTERVTLFAEKLQLEINKYRS